MTSKNLITLYINSKDRSNINDPSTNFLYNLFPLGINNCKSFFVKSVSIPLTNYVTVYPSATGGAQTFELVNFLNTYTISIPTGNYTAQQLATTIQTELNTVATPTTFAVNYNTNTNIYTITSTLTGSFNFAVNNALYPYQSLGSTIGYRDNSHTPINISGNAVAAPFEASLSGPLNYYVKSSALTTSTNSFFQTNKNSVISCIPNNATPFGVISYLNPAPYFEPLYSTRINQLDLSLVDEYGNNVILNDDWTIAIAFNCDE